MILSISSPAVGVRADDFVNLFGSGVGDDFVSSVGSVVPCGSADGFVNFFACGGRACR